MGTDGVVNLTEYSSDTRHVPASAAELAVKLVTRDSSNTFRGFV